MSIMVLIKINEFNHFNFKSLDRLLNINTHIKPLTACKSELRVFVL